jgi:hypothetical protein
MNIERCDRGLDYSSEAGKGIDHEAAEETEPFPVQHRQRREGTGSPECEDHRGNRDMNENAFDEVTRSFG